MELIDRPEYIEKITSLINRGMMLILVGQRRVGKSKILELFRNWLGSARPEANVVYINKEYQAFRDIATARQLYDYAVGRLPEGEENYLLIDEVQDIENYESALRSLHAEDRCQVIATGSNAYILSGELGTYLSGRYIEIKVYALSYCEFLRFHDLEDCEESLMNYLLMGGLPGLRAFKPEEQSLINDYLEGVYNTVLVKDIVRRGQVRNVTQLENIVRFVADNIGKPISITNISRYMASKSDRISSETVSNYLKYYATRFRLFRSNGSIYMARCFSSRTANFISQIMGYVTISAAMTCAAVSRKLWKTLSGIIFAARDSKSRSDFSVRAK